MHTIKINIKNQVCRCYFNNSIEEKKIKAKNILIDGKNYKAFGDLIY